MPPSIPFRLPNGSAGVSQADQGKTTGGLREDHGRTTRGLRENHERYTGEARENHGGITGGLRVDHGGSTQDHGRMNALRRVFFGPGADLTRAERPQIMAPSWPIMPPSIPPPKADQGRNTSGSRENHGRTTAGSREERGRAGVPKNHKRSARGLREDH